MATPQNRVIGLDVFRSLAILSVLACHYLEVVTVSTPFRDALTADLGTYGVELFFVLSGFLIGGILIRELELGGPGLATVRRFWIRRWYRTLPNYFFYLLLMFIVLRPWRTQTAGLWQYPFFLQNLAWDIKPFFVVSWSLAIEEWFYFSFPLLLFALGKLTTDRRRIVLAGILIFLTVPFLLRLALTGNRLSNDGVRQVVIFRLDAIALGVLLAYLKCYQAKFWRALCAWPVLLAGLAGVALTCAYAAKVDYGHDVILHGYQNAFFFGAVDLSCALMLPWFSSVSDLRGPARAIFVWISTLSYSLYLCHLLVMVIIGGILVKLHLWPVPGAVNLLLEIAGAMALALLSYYFIERPFLRLRERRAPDI
jgi:peptidoglycan/LPS O-acetylase OafA/YrhL